ncbi:hypothetical protein AX774_g2885, partial [Zancudomyces culisetae]
LRDGDNFEGRASGAATWNGTTEGRVVPREGNRPGGGGSIREESSGEDFRGYTGVLFPDVLYPQEEWQAEASIRSEELEPVRGQAEIQDGILEVNMSTDQERGFHDLNRSPRRFSPCEDQREITKLTEIHMEEPTLPVSSTAIRNDNIPTGIHKDCETNRSLGQEPRYAGSRIFGRPDNPGPDQANLHREHAEIEQEAENAGLSDQQRQIYNDTEPEYGTLGFQDTDPLSRLDTKYYL